MGNFSYSVVPGKIKPLMAKIRTVGVPTKVTVQWLKSVGFKSSNDKTLIGVLKFIGFIDASGVPTDRWSQYRGGAHKRVLGDAIRQGYSDLFAVYADANQRSQTDLDHVFSTSSSGGKQVIAKTIATFRALVEEAEFSLVGETDLHIETGPLHTPPINQPREGEQLISSGPALHIDIQIHISPEASPEQIEQIFASMAKHVYGPRTAKK